MALFKVCRGAEGNLPSTKTDGYAYFCTDTGSFYIDYKNASNTLVRSKISAQYADMLRYKDQDGDAIEIDPSTILTNENYATTIGVATIQKSGLMSNVDKEKLDGVSIGAQANVQADWNENDPTSDAYINNRPFYTTSPQEVSVCSGTYNFIDASETGVALYRANIDADYSQFADEVGQEVRIIYDGTTYNLITKYIDALDMYYVGNGSLLNSLGVTAENTEEPFIYSLGAYFFTSETDAQHTIQIFVSKTEVITISHKYLGMSVWAGEKENSIVMHTEDNVASGFRSLATGLGTTASGDRSHAEGNDTTASAENAHAEGNGTTASNFNAHAEGVDTVASGHTSHAEGVRTEASGQASHAEGNDTKASAWNAHAEGQGTEAASKSQHVFGEYNIVDKSAGVAERGKYIQIAGNGGSENAKSNAYTLDWNGVAWFKGGVKIGGTGQDDVAAKTLATTDVATTDTAGLMSKEDKSKLDGVAEGATKGVVTIDTQLSAVEILALTEGVYYFTYNARFPIYLYDSWVEDETAYVTDVVIQGLCRIDETYIYSYENGFCYYKDGTRTIDGVDQLCCSTDSAYPIQEGYAGMYQLDLRPTIHVMLRQYPDGSIEYENNNNYIEYLSTFGWGISGVLTQCTIHTNNTSQDFELYEIEKLVGEDEYLYGIKYVGYKDGFRYDVLCEIDNITVTKTEIITKLASTTANGYMSASDKTKLDSIEAGATKTVVDSAMSSTSTNPVQNNVVNTALDKKLNAENPTGTGSLSLNRNGDTTIGRYSVAVGYNNTASGKYSEAHGYQTTSTDVGSHAEGHGTTASGYASHAEGYNTEALNAYTHAEGYCTTVGAMTSHAEGHHTKAMGASQHVQGRYNIASGILAHIVGNGEDDDNRSNAHTLDWDGNAWFAGHIKIGGKGQDDTAAKTIATTDVVTTTTNGLMSNSDKSKLDGISEGATNTLITIKTWTTADMGGAS